MGQFITYVEDLLIRGGTPSEGDGLLRDGSGQWVPVPIYTTSEVDALIASIDLSPYMPKAGGTFTGPIAGTTADLYTEATGPALRLGGLPVGSLNDVSLDFYVNNLGSVPPYARIALAPTDATIGSEDTALIFSTISAGTLAERFRVETDGALLVTGSLATTGDVTIGATLLGGLAGDIQIGSDLNLNTKSIHMNSGSGSGGGSVDMDAGMISNLGALDLNPAMVSGTPPAGGAGPVPTDYYGSGGTKMLSEPTDWIGVVVNGNIRLIPAYAIP